MTATANISELHAVATARAAAKARELNATLGQAWPCGFAWVNVSGVKLSTKVGKEFARLGFRKAYGYRNTVQLWNPSGHPTQNMDVKEMAAEEYADVFRAAGYDAFVGSRMD
ncbi:MAG: hypothetical protein EBT04_14900 [Betaproteobacteria bacterium]|nr:hypothetical protein [Betaproteobacteria bacterium]